MEYKLRKYQVEAVETGIKFFGSADRTKPLLVLPTGSGKSLIIAYIVKALRGKVLILQPTKELLEQNYCKYENAIQGHPELEQAGIFSASVGVKEIKRVTFAMIGSVVNRAEEFADVEYILIDECHKVPPKKSSMYVDFLSKMYVKVIGLTATPFRLKTYNDPWCKGKKFSKINLLNRETPRFFNKFLHVTQIGQMYDEGFLCPINYIEMQFDGAFLKLNSTGAEYSEKSLKEAISRNKIIEKIPGILKQAFEKGRTACLVFVQSVEEARQLASITPFSAYVHALTEKKEREQIIKDFKNGNIKTIFNVGILVEGFDYPDLDTIILARPTMSLTLYMQMIGRGIRIAKDKEHCSVLDMCGNIKRFGKIEELRIEFDRIFGWVLRNDSKILSGRRLDDLS